jgi:hypothetical protein
MISEPFVTFEVETAVWKGVFTLMQNTGLVVAYSRYSVQLGIFMFITQVHKKKQSSCRVIYLNP